jgi:hypothetical protein
MRSSRAETAMTTARNIKATEAFIARKAEID